MSTEKPHPLPDRRQSIACLVAFVLGMVVLSLAGRLVSHHDLFERFVRLHNYISPQAYFYPTASQLVALAEDAGRTADVVVVVGGDSILQGFGQGDDELWSAELQRLLGDRYAVVNVAMYEARSVESGGVTAEALTKAGRQVISITDQRMPGFGPPDGSQFRYLYWDASYKGLLIEDEERDEYLRTHVPPFNLREPTTQTELQIRSALDSQLYFTDLWSSVGYTTLFTAWAPLIPPNVPFVTPRRALSLDRDYFEFPFDPRAQDPLYTAMIALSCNKAPNGELTLAGDHPFWGDFERDARISAPRAVRERTIIWLPYIRAFNLSHLSPAELRCVRHLYDVGAARLSNVGFHPAVFGADWEVSDYLDHYHLVGRGGRKLAAELAPRVQALAQELGYLQPPR
ncbi:MAG: hypothetical protein U0893_15265 [Chloroflexota bacterium]